MLGWRGHILTSIIICHNGMEEALFQIRITVYSIALSFIKNLTAHNNDYMQKATNTISSGVWLSLSGQCPGSAVYRTRTSSTLVCRAGVSPRRRTVSTVWPRLVSSAVPRTPGW